MTWWFREPCKYWYRGRWFGSQWVAGANTAQSPSGPVHWHSAGNTVLVYQYAEDSKDLALWEVWTFRTDLPVVTEKRIKAIMSFLSKKPPANAGKTNTAVGDKDWQKRWPALWEYLTSPSYGPDGPPRKLATISLFLGTQGLTACCNDRDNARACFGTASTLLGALDALEGMVKSDDTVWKEDKQQTGSSARKKS